MLAAEEVAHSAGWFLEHAWLIPLIPGVAFVVIILFGKFEINGKRVLPMGGAEIGIASMVAALVLAIGDDLPVDRSCRAAPHEAEPVIKTWTWWQIGGLKFGIGEHIDGLAVMMLLLVAFISTLVQIYSLEYVRGDRRYTHFFASHHAVQRRHVDDGARREHGAADPRLGDHGPVLVPADRALVGGARPTASAALKAFFTVRVGDIGLLVGTAIMFGASGTF